jgi:hypothetical protein
LPPVVAALALGAFRPPPADSACCYFSAKDKDINQPAQKAFITFDPAEKVETFTVQPKFEGNALDFGMVIPTPSQPKLHEMPREFFKHLAVYSILSKREFPQSKLLPQNVRGAKGGGGIGGWGVPSFNGLNRAGFVARGKDDSVTNLDGSRIRHDVTYTDKDFTPEALTEVLTPPSASD